MRGSIPHTAWLWKKRLRGLTPVTTSFASVVVGAAPASGGAFELVVRGGMALRIPPDFDGIRQAYPTLPDLV